MIDVAVKYGIDLSDVRRLEGIYGERLPDILEPLRQLDCEADAIKTSLREYRDIAEEVEAMSAELGQIRAETTWTGDAAQAANAVVDVLLSVLEWIAAILLFIIAVVLLLLALVLYAIGQLLQAIGKAIAVAAAIVAVVVVIWVAIRSGGKGNTGRLAAIWATLRAVFDTVYLAGLGTVGALGDGFGWLFEQAAKGVEWLALYLIEVGVKLTGTPDDDPDLGRLRKERNRLFG